jgi:predicted PurR-regulated permease PerM
MNDSRGLFSQRDLKLLRATAMLGSFVALTGMVVLIFWTLAYVLSYFYVLLLPLSIAGVLALVLAPIVQFLEDHLRIRRIAAVVLLYVIMLAGGVSAFLLVIPIVTEQIKDLVSAAPDLFERAGTWLRLRFPTISDFMAQYLGSIESSEEWIPSIENVRDFLSSSAGLLIGLGFIPLFLFFMLVSGKRLKGSVTELTSVLSTQKQEELSYLSKQFVGYVMAFFQGQLIIAMIMGTLLAIGFTVIGLQAAIFLGLVLGLLNIIPFLGVVVGLMITVPVAWIQPGGGLDLVIQVSVLFAAVQALESWVLTPRIMSDKSGLHPAIVVVSLFFWGILFGGVIGMLLAVPLSAFLVSLWRHIKTHYLNVVISEPGNGDLDTAREASVIERSTTIDR